MFSRLKYLTRSTLCAFTLHLSPKGEEVFRTKQDISQPSRKNKERFMACQSSQIRKFERSFPMGDELYSRNQQLGSLCHMLQRRWRHQSRHFLRHGWILHRYIGTCSRIIHNLKVLLNWQRRTRSFLTYETNGYQNCQTNCQDQCENCQCN